MTILLQPYCSSRVKPPSQLWESLNMRKMFITLAATSALALGACQSPQADKVEDQAEAQAEAIDDQADAMPAVGRAHVLTPVTNAHLVCRLLLEKKNNN